MATSGPGWEGIDVAWDWMQFDLEQERLQRQREAEQAPPPLNSQVGATGRTTAR